MPSDMDVASLALLTRRELDWLLGKTGDMSKSFKYKVKSSLRKKIQTFFEIELPLLLKNGLLPITNDSFSPSTNYPLRNGISLDGDSSLGKAKVPGPNPGQGLPIFRKGERNGEFDNFAILHPAVIRIHCRINPPASTNKY